MFTLGNSMALVNPNIALAGVPMQVPNFLGMQQTAAATQNTLARTGIMQEEAARASESATYNTALSRSKDALRFVNSPDQYLAWTESSFNDPVLGPVLQSMGVDRQKAVSSARELLLQPGGLQTAIGKSASSIDQLAQSMTAQGGQARTQAQAQAKTAEANAARAREQAIIQRIMGESGTNALAPAPTGAAPTGNALAAPPGASIMTDEATAAAMPAAQTAPAAQATPASQANALRNQIGQLRQAAAMGVKSAATAADQLEKRLNLIEPAKAGATAGDLQKYNVAVSQGYKGSLTDFAREQAALTANTQPIEMMYTDPETGEQLVGLFSYNTVTGETRPVGQTSLRGTAQVGALTPAPVSEATPAAVAMATEEQLPSVDSLSTPLLQTPMFKKPPKGNKVTEDERKGAAALQRVLSASDQIAGVTAKNASAAAPGVSEMVAGILPLWDSASSEIQNWARPIDRQIVSAAQRDMIDALLFLATGAAYNKEQLQGQMDSYLPKYTDKSKKVLDAKRTRLIELIQGARARAGGAWTPELDAKVQNLIKTSFPDASTSDIPPPPEGADDEFKRLWPKMTPEDRKLWQK
jgi:hypothetical protein